MSISILKDPWLSGEDHPFIQTVHVALQNKMVSSLMITGENRWDVDPLNDIFISRDINCILSIPLQHNNADIKLIYFDMYFTIFQNNKRMTYNIKCYKIMGDLCIIITISCNKTLTLVFTFIHVKMLLSSTVKLFYSRLYFIQMKMLLSSSYIHVFSYQITDIVVGKYGF